MRGGGSSGEESDSESDDDDDDGEERAQFVPVRSSVEGVLPASSATSNVLNMSDHNDAGLPSAPRGTHAPEIAGMLSSISAKARKLEAKKSLAESAKKSAKKKTQPIKGTPIPTVAKLGTPGSGASGKSMVVRKPPSYTGASNDRFLRGRSPSADAAAPRSSERKKPLAGSASASKASASKRLAPTRNPQNSGRKVSSVPGRLQSKNAGAEAAAAAVNKVNASHHRLLVL
jgi:hypothetical protein